jgi:hypothetical protein
MAVTARAISARMHYSHGCLEYLALPVPPRKMPPEFNSAISETLPTLQDIRTCSAADIIRICSSITKLKLVN